MFVLNVTKNQIKLAQSEKMTSGSQNVYVIQFNFSDEWDVLERTAVFATDIGPDGPVVEEVYNQLLGEDNSCFIPWEVNKEHDKHVYVGVFGAIDGNVVLPTVWIDIGNVQLGVTTGLEIQPPTQTLWEQILGELYLIRRDVKNIEIGTALEVFADVSINNIGMLALQEFPRSVIMINSSFLVDAGGNSESLTIPFVSDTVYLERKDYYEDEEAEENQNGIPAVFVTNLLGETVALTYDENGFFTRMIPIKKTIDPDDFLAYGTFALTGFGENPPSVENTCDISASNFVGRKPKVDETFNGLGWLTNGNIYRFKAVCKSVEDDIFHNEITEAEWLKVVGADGADGTSTHVYGEVKTITGDPGGLTSFGTVGDSSLPVSNTIKTSDILIVIEKVSSTNDSYLCFYTVNNVDHNDSGGVQSIDLTPISHTKISGENGENGKSLYVYGDVKSTSGKPSSGSGGGFGSVGGATLPVSNDIKAGDTLLVLAKDDDIGEVYLCFYRIEDLEHNSTGDVTDLYFTIVESVNIAGSKGEDGKSLYVYEGVDPVTDKPEVGEVAGFGFPELFPTPLPDTIKSGDSFLKLVENVETGEVYLCFYRVTAVRYRADGSMRSISASVTASVNIKGEGGSGGSIPVIGYNETITTPGSFLTKIGVPDATTEWSGEVMFEANSSIAYGDNTFNFYDSDLVRCSLDMVGMDIDLSGTGDSQMFYYASFKLYMSGFSYIFETSLASSKENALSSQFIKREMFTEVSKEYVDNKIINAAHGGTGQTTLENSMYALINGISDHGTESYTFSTTLLPAVRIINNESGVRKLKLSDILYWATGRSNTVTMAGTDYTTARSRAISLHTTMPTEGLVNGQLYGIYQ